VHRSFDEVWLQVFHVVHHLVVHQLIHGEGARHLSHFTLDPLQILSFIGMFKFPPNAGKFSDPLLGPPDLRGPRGFLPHSSSNGSYETRVDLAFFPSLSPKPFSAFLECHHRVAVELYQRWLLQAWTDPTGLSRGRCTGTPLGLPTAHLLRPSYFHRLPQLPNQRCCFFSSFSPATP
jgi:hypothetical protein